MSTHLIIWNPNTSNYSLRHFYGDFNSAYYLDGVEDFSLNIKNYKDISVNDTWFLIQIGTENSGIAAYGTFMDPSELNYDEYEKEFYNDEVFMIDRNKCYKLTYVEIKNICPEIVNLKDGDKCTISSDQEVKLFDLVLDSLSNMKGPNEFINYSTDLHPDLIEELGGESDFLEYLKNKSKESEYHQLSIIDKAILKSVIGQEVMHFCCWNSKSEKTNFVSFVAKPRMAYGTWINLVPHIDSSESDNFIIKVFTEELYPKYNEKYDPRNYDGNHDEYRINEILQDVKIITDIYTRIEKEQEFKLIIDVGFIFEFPDFSVIINTQDSKSSYFKIQICDVNKYNEELDKIKTDPNIKGTRSISSVLC